MPGYHIVTLCEIFTHWPRPWYELEKKEKPQQAEDLLTIFVWNLIPAH